MNTSHRIISTFFFASVFLFGFLPLLTFADTTPTALYSFDANTLNFSTNTAQDTSGNNNTATMSGLTSASVIPGTVGDSALQFNGSNQIVTVPANAALNNLSQVTLSAWIKPTTEGGIQVIAEQLNGVVGFNLFLNGNTLFTYYGNSNTVGTAITPGVWTHVAMTADGSHVNLYVNGTLVATRAVTGIPMNAGLTIGARTGGYYFNGAIDDVRVYNTMLSAAQVMAIYQHN